MKLLIPAMHYHIWKDFELELSNDITISTGSIYQLTGNNGAGKSSFIKKVIIPKLQKYPANQYIIYIEQQIQSQFDAVKAYAALQKPPIQINNFTDMISYQFSSLSKQMQSEPRPIVVIVDESRQMEMITQVLSLYNQEDYCLIYVSHDTNELVKARQVINITFKPVSRNLTVVS